jgi:hypothetical protein
MNKKLGYYTCNNVEFSSKIEACIYATKIKQPLKWHFNNAELFRKVGTSREKASS